MIKSLIRHKLTPILIVSLLSPGTPVLTLAGQPAAESDVLESSIATARACIRDGEYDRATEILKSAITEARGRNAKLREAYLLLIQTYFYRGNALRNEREGRIPSELCYQEARQLITECLQTKELRHTIPDPPTDYPPEMIKAFQEVRGQIFGSLRLTKVEPPDAIVVMDGDTLRPQPSHGLLEAVDIPVGPHILMAKHDGFRIYTEELTIHENVILESSIEMEKNRGLGWYAVWVGAPITAAAALTGILLHGGETQSASPAVFGTPPPPPNP